MVRCGHCLASVPESLAYQTHSGETLCGPCYFELWGPRGSHVLSKATERLRPQTKRSKRRSAWMVPGPSGELDPEEQVRRLRWRRRRD